MAVASSSSASVAVEKATSDLLIGPDWTMNIDICDSLNSNHWLAKDVVKAVKKRLQHKNPKVQLLALTLLETMVKNCGDYVHFQIAEKNILGEMNRIVKKKTDMHVREKILVLLDSWQEAFGGPGGKYPQYYWAYEELRRSGVEFPQRSLNAAPIFTPPIAHSSMRHTQAGYGMPSNSSRRLDETMATEIESLSLSSLDSIRNVMELLGDMLQAVNPDDREAVKDEIIVDLVDRCRSNQKKLMQMLTTTGDEELLGQGLELNDSLQILLAKHDAIASGHPMPSQIANLGPKPSEGGSSSVKQTEVKQAEVKDTGSSPCSSAVIGTPTTRGHLDEEDEEEDDFAQLARRHSKPQSSPSQTFATSNALVPVDTGYGTSSVPTYTTSTSNALALPESPSPVRTTKEQDMIDLLSMALSTTSTSYQPHTPHTPSSSNQSTPQGAACNQSMPQAPTSSTLGYSYIPQTYPGNQGQPAYNSYVVPWAQPQQQNQLQFPSQPHLQSQVQPQTLSESHQHLQAQPRPEFSQQSQPQAYSQPQPRQQFSAQPQPQPYSQPQPQQQFQTPSQQHSQQQPQAQSQAQPQPQLQQQFQAHSQQHSQPQAQPQPQFQQQFQIQSQQHCQQQPQPQPQFQQQFQTQSQQHSQQQQRAQAQAQAQHRPQLQQQFQTPPQQQHSQQQNQAQAQPLSRQQYQPQPQQSFQPQLQSQYPQYSSGYGYPPPPWAATPGYANGQIHTSNTSNMLSAPQSNTAASYTPAQAARPMQHSNSFTSSGSNALSLNGNPWVGSGPRSSAPLGQKPFVPSYRLFEDLNVLGNSDGRFKMTGNSSPSLSGPSTRGLVGGRK